MKKILIILLLTLKSSSGFSHLIPILNLTAEHVSIGVAYMKDNGLISIDGDLSNLIGINIPSGMYERFDISDKHRTIDSSYVFYIGAAWKNINGKRVVIDKNTYFSSPVSVIDLKGQLLYIVIQETQTGTVIKYSYQGSYERSKTTDTVTDVLLDISEKKSQSKHKKKSRKCDHCRKLSDNTKRCKGCKKKRYCSRKCQKRSWVRDKHREKCPGRSYKDDNILLTQ